MTIAIRPCAEADIDEIETICREAFPPDDFHVERWLRGGRVLTEGGRVQAVLLTERVGQFYGGRAVPMAFLSSLGVRVPARGHGLSGLLLRETLAELAREAVPLAVHFPHVLATFRRVGFEVGGVQISYRAPLHAVPFAAIHAVEEWDAAALPEIAACYRCFATRNTGLADRTETWWHDRVLRPDAWGGQLWRYLVRRDGQVSGYLLYARRRLGNFDGRERYTIVCPELVWLDEDAARTLLGIAAYLHPYGHDLLWPGPIDEPLTTAFDLDPSIDASARWLLRLTDVPAALRERGYPIGVQATIALEVSDPALPANNGAFRLDVSDGRATLERVASATVQVDAGTLAALYSGWLAPRTAARLGRLRQAGETDLAALEMIFADRIPWLIDGA